ncbi:hypothetical protein BH09ACT3_BH09ACT3_15540 [soil metagenome]
MTLASRTSLAGEVLLVYLDDQVRMLREQGLRVRQNEPDSVHQMRVATRRLRSVLRTYRPLLDAETANRLRGELGWLAGILGTARDLQVMRQRLMDRIAAEPRELVMGAVSGRIDGTLGAEFEVARLAVLTALDDERYGRLLEDFDSLLVAPPLAAPAFEPARGIVPDLLRWEWRRLRTTVTLVRACPPGTPRDLALHEVRKSAKRLRFAAEAAVPVRRRPALRLAAAAEELQTILGDHQDAVVARERLRRWGMEAPSHGENAFSYGRLDALEQAAAADADARFLRAWRTFPGPSLGG